MAAKIHELRARRAALATKANTELEALQAKAKAEGRALTPDELKAQDAYDLELKALDDEIKLEERKADRERGSAGFSGAPSATPAVPGSGPIATDMVDRAARDPRRGFSSHREFLQAVMENAGVRTRAEVTDEKLRPLAVFDKDDRASGGELAFMLPAGFSPRAAVGSDEQGTYSDQYGGFAVPTSRAPGLLEVGFEGDPTAGRTQSIPMQTPTVEIMARVDKNHSTSVTGGLTVTRRPETGAAAPSRAQLEMVTLKASSLFGLAYATEELLTDSPLSFIAIIDSGFRTQFAAHMLNEKLRGLGGSEYQGIINAPCAISQAAEGGQGADTIKALNVIKMRARCWGYGNAIWIANHDTLPQLLTMFVATGADHGQLIYTVSATEGKADMLLGRPIFYTEFASKLGDVGDLILWNPTQYLEGIYQPLQSAESVHVRFINHERTFKMWLRNAGAPWWRSALTPAKSADTLSPIVTLAAR